MSAAYPGDVGPVESEESVIDRGRALVAQHPWAAVGAAAGAGAALGLLTGGRRRSGSIERAVASGVDPAVASRHSLLRTAFSMVGRALVMQALSKIVRQQSESEPFPGGNQ